MRIFLVGFMGCGKTTLGDELASIMGLEFIDMDLYIEERYKMSVVSFFDIFGEDKFREIEHNTLLEILSKKTDSLISLGGGTPCFYNNMDIIINSGLSVYIKLTVDELYKRLYKTKKRRPLLINKNSEELRRYIEEVLNKRESIYMKSHIIVDGYKLKAKDLYNIIINYEAQKKE